MFYEETEKILSDLAEVTQAVDAAGHAVSDDNTSRAGELLRGAMLRINSTIEQMEG